MKKATLPSEANNTGNPRITVRLPVEISEPLLRDVTQMKCTVQAKILAILGEYYGAEPPQPAKGRPRKLE